MNKANMKNVLIDGLAILLGGLIWSVSINVFTLPNHIVPGGFTGVATILYDFIHFPIGIMIFLLNIPLFFVGWKLYGKTFFIKTGIALASTALIVDITAMFLPEYTEDKLLAAIFGGVLAGIGLGLIYMRGMATGGVDLVARILEKPFPFISYGKLIIICDALVAIAAGFAYRELSAVLYAAIVIFLTGTINDKLINGLDRGKLVYIITDNPVQISQALLAQIKRGVTVLETKGAYTGKGHSMLMVIVRPYEFHRIKKIVNSIDKKSFIIVSDVSEVVGEGFKSDKH